MTDLVIFYSRTNNTKLVAQTIKEETGAQLLEIKDTKSRSGPIGYMKGALDAMRDKRTKIEYDNVDLKTFDTVYIGGPVWASKPAPAITQFIQENDFGGVQTVTFCTMGGSGDQSTLEYMDHMIVRSGGKVKDSFSIAVKNNNIKELTKQALINKKD